MKNKNTKENIDWLLSHVNIQFIRLEQFPKELEGIDSFTSVLDDKKEIIRLFFKQDEHLWIMFPKNNDDDGTAYIKIENIDVLFDFVDSKEEMLWFGSQVHWETEIDGYTLQINNEILVRFYEYEVENRKQIGIGMIPEIQREISKWCGILPYREFVMKYLEAYKPVCFDTIERGDFCRFMANEVTGMEYPSNMDTTAYNQKFWTKFKQNHKKHDLKIL